jgi:hypothetical protein
MNCNKTNRNKIYGSILALSACLGLSFLTACGGSSKTTTPTNTVAITASSGGGQSAQVSTAFAAPLVANVTTGGTVTSGASVTFTCPASGASCTFASNGTATETDTTDVNGNATSSAVSANSTAGAYTVTAGTGSVSANFSLTNNAAPVPTIGATSGGGQSTVISTPFAASLIATVTLSGSGDSGVSVTFTCPAAGASCTFASTGTATETDTTDVNGNATSSAVSANATAGGYTVSADFAGDTGSPASFGLNNTSGTPAAIVPTSGGGQSTTVSTAFGAPLVATVTDATSIPVQGVAVTFTAPSSGASGTFASNGTSTETDTTDVNGNATSSTLTANATSGSYNVSADFAGDLGSPATFALTNAGAAAGTNNWVFYANGMEAINDGPNYYALAGAVTIDASGDILAGEEDYNDAFGVTSPGEPTPDTIAPANAALVVDPSTGQGTLTLTSSYTSTGVNGVQTFALQFVNSSHALIMQFDGTATSSGSFDLQTPCCSGGGGATNGLAFTMSGVDNEYNTLAFGGVFSIGGGGGGSPTFNFTADFNDAGTISTGNSYTGTSTNGDNFNRGVITGLSNPITDSPISVAYYLVGPSSTVGVPTAVRLIDVDFEDSASGSAYSQGTNFTGGGSGSLTGNFVFANAANTWLGGAATLGQFTTDGDGNITAGVADDNELINGIGEINDAAISGNYAIGPNGYGTFNLTQATTLGTVSALGLYDTDPTVNLNDPNNPTGGGGALLLDLDDDLPGVTGVVVPQTDNNASDFNGNYAGGIQNVNVLSEDCPYCEFDILMQGSIVAGGTLSLTGDVNDPFGTLLGVPTATSGDAFSGTLAPYSPSVGPYYMPVTATIDGETGGFGYDIYQASAGQLFWIDISVNGSDQTLGVALGPVQQQGDLSGIPAKKSAAKTKAKTKH